MSDPVAPTEDELRRLAECAKEPIRTPGRIQSHGVLLGIDPESMVIELASENAAGHLGTLLSEPTLLQAIRSSNPVDPIRVVFDGSEYDAIVHPNSDRVIIELESAIVGLAYARTGVVGAVHRMSSIDDPTTLRQEAADTIRALTGFDRVMVYHFHPDGHGEVVAEARVDEMEPYLGLHFPSSDIPPQARALYVSKHSRAIVRTDDPGIPLLALDGDAASTDLSDAELRAVSPYHLQYMRNMGQASTVSFSLVWDGQLIGMITCAHRTERRLPVLLRRALEVLAHQVSLQLHSIGEIRRLRHDVEVRERRAALLSPLFASDDILAALFYGEHTVLDLVPADGVALLLGGTLSTLGNVPSRARLREFFERAGSGEVATNALAQRDPELAATVPSVAGVIVVPLGAGNSMAFFRGEVTQVVNWLGDPGASNRPDPLSPRLSFSSWQQSVRGTSLPWGSVRGEAAELGRELEGALQRRNQARLAELAMHDALTGLRNRRFFGDNLARALRERQTPDSVSLLFVDLDDFKSINDTHGHDVGDAVIVEIGRRLVVNSRSADAVARLGGDEFVIVAEHTTPADALALADRIVAAVSEPILSRGGKIEVTASCGIVTAGDLSEGAELLESADAAMYRAKSAGRNRVAV